MKKDTGNEFKSKRYMKVQIAKMYYFDHMTQEEIAQKTSYSRPSISRILNGCVDEGIVQISIHDHMSRLPDVANTLKKRWKLNQVFITATSTDNERTRRNAGELAANYLMAKLQDNMLLGITAGRISYYAARALDNASNLKIDVIQLLGNTKAVYGPDSGQGLAAVFASKLYGACYIVQAPIYVKNAHIKKSLLADQILAACFAKYPCVDVALLELEMPQLYRNTQPNPSWLSQPDMVQLNELGATVCICGRYFDIDGYPCNAGINERIIGIDIDVLKSIPEKVVVACGMQMSDAVYSSLKADMVDALIIDEALARKLMIKKQ